MSPDDRTVEAVATVTKAKVTRAQLADKYPTLLVVDRGSFKLRLYKKLKLTKTYTVAVGAVGFDTPSGLYNIQNKGVNVPWSVPNKPWAGASRARSSPAVPPTTRSRPAGWDLRRRGHPRHRSGRLTWKRRLTRLCAHGDPGRDRALRPGSGLKPGLHRLTLVRA